MTLTRAFTIFCLSISVGMLMDLLYVKLRRVWDSIRRQRSSTGSRRYRRKASSGGSGGSPAAFRWSRNWGRPAVAAEELPEPGGLMLLPSSLLCCVCGAYVDLAADRRKGRRWQVVQIAGEMVGICPRHLDYPVLVIGGGPAESLSTRPEFLRSLKAAVIQAGSNRAHAKEN